MASERVAVKGLEHKSEVEEFHYDSEYDGSDYQIGR
jgi:hypothetical protein